VFDDAVDRGRKAAVAAIIAREELLGDEDLIEELSL
jgi:hypothetical protein